MKCNHVGTRGKNAGVACRNKPNEGSLYCKKHKKREPSDLSTDDVFGNGARTNVQIENKPVKHRFSSYKFTLNSNQDYEKMTKEQKQQWKDLIEFVFARENLVRYLEDKTDPDPNKNLHELKVEFYHEVGSAQGRLHTHGVISVEHSGFYRVCVEKIRGVIEKILGKSIHLNVVGSADTEAMWKQYITKSQTAQKVNL